MKLKELSLLISGDKELVRRVGGVRSGHKLRDGGFTQ